MTIKFIENGGKNVRGVSCPLCSHTDVHYRKETDTYVCGHCDYSWYTIEHCYLQS